MDVPFTIQEAESLWDEWTTKGGRLWKGRIRRAFLDVVKEHPDLDRLVFLEDEAHSLWESWGLPDWCGFLEAAFFRVLASDLGIKMPRAAERKFEVLLEDLMEGRY